MQVPMTLSLDYPTKKMLEQMAQESKDENMSEIVRRLISREWKYYHPADPTPTQEWHGEGVS